MYFKEVKKKLVKDKKQEEMNTKWNSVQNEKVFSIEIGKCYHDNRYYSILLFYYTYIKNYVCTSISL